ncbi:MAG: hypothetical protein ACRC6M_11830 [Microcystaceae cyanobacterium]
MTNLSKFRKLKSLGSLLEFLLMTSAIALAAGIGFGAAIRFGQPEALPGQTTTIQKEQSFPPRENWPSTKDSPSQAK